MELLPKLNATSRRWVLRWPHETIVSSFANAGLYAHTSIVRSLPPSRSETEFGPWNVSVTPLKLTPLKPVPATLAVRAGAPELTEKFPNATWLVQVDGVNMPAAARKSTYNVPA